MLRNFQAVKVTWRPLCFLAAMSILISWAVLAITDLVRQRGLSRQNASAPAPPTIEPWLLHQSSVEEDLGPVGFDIALPPNPKTSWAMMAIVPVSQISPRHAAALARYARKVFRKSPRWQGVTVYVFGDKKSGKVFGEYQIARAGRRLQQADYEKLTALWSKALVCYTYTYKQGKESVLYPSKNPKGWWKKP